jgi:hypothetical protein
MFWSTIPLSLVALPVFLWTRRFILSLRKKDCLKNNEIRVRDRLSELADREAKLQKIQSNMRKSPVAESLTTTQALIDNTLPLIARMKARYLSEAWRISIVRWNNQIEPVLSRNQDERRTMIEKDIESVQSYIDKTAKLRNTLKENKYLGVEMSINNMLVEVEELTSLAKEMLQLLFSEQTRMTLKDLSPLSSTNYASKMEIYRNTFNTSKETMMLKKSLDELQSEYDRIDAEDFLV